MASVSKKWKKNWQEHQSEFIEVWFSKWEERENKNISNQIFWLEADQRPLCKYW